MPLVNLDYDAADEPRLALPLPPGWRLVPDPEPSLPMVRAMTKGPGEEANRYQPNAVVTLEMGTDPSQTPQQALEEQIAASSPIGAVIDEIRGTTCGYPSAIITYDVGVRDREATCLVMVGQKGDGALWSAVVAIQAFDPHNPDYVNEKDAILSGFQFAFAGD